MATPEESGKKADEFQKQAFPTRRRVSLAPVAVPPPSKKKVPSSKKRWSLVRSLAKGKRLTSLTEEEDAILRTLSSHDKNDLKKQPSSDEDDTNARKSLRKSIAVRSSMLTNAEMHFLENLVDAPDVAPEHIEHVNEVLCGDPLYQCKDEVTTTSKEEEEKKASPGQRTWFLEYPSYRKEVWTTLRAEGDEMLAQTFAFNSARNDTKGEGKKETAVVKEGDHAKPDKRKSYRWGFIYNFQKALNLVDNRDKEDDDTEEETPDDDLDDELNATFCVLAYSIEELLENPPILSPPIMDALRAFLPFAVQHDNFWLKYSMVRDGASFFTLLNKIRNSARTILVVETDQGDVFGSFTSSPWRILPGQYYGSAEAFLWRLKKSRFAPCASVEDQIALESDVEVFEWSRNNRNIQSWSGLEGEMSVGGGGYEDNPEKDARDYCAGLSLSSDLSRGTSEKCLTFHSPRLPTRGTGAVFNIANIEVWALTPVLSVEEAEELELSRQFIFDHGGFRQQ